MKAMHLKLPMLKPKTAQYLASASMERNVPVSQIVQEELDSKAESVIADTPSQEEKPSCENSSSDEEKATA